MNLRKYELKESGNSLIGVEFMPLFCDSNHVWLLRRILIQNRFYLGLDVRCKPIISLFQKS